MVSSSGIGWLNDQREPAAGGVRSWYFMDSKSARTGHHFCCPDRLDLHEGKGRIRRFRPVSPPWRSASEFGGLGAQPAYFVLDHALAHTPNGEAGIGPPWQSGRHPRSPAERARERRHSPAPRPRAARFRPCQHGRPLARPSPSKPG